MEQYISNIKKNERLIFIVLPIVMAVIFAFFPIIDIYGKATANGLQLIFGGKSGGLGKFFAIMPLLLPVVAIVLQFITVELPAKIASCFNVIWTALSLFFILLMAVALPRGVTLAWGGYLYCLFGIAGIVSYFLVKR